MSAGTPPLGQRSTPAASTLAAKVCCGVRPGSSASSGYSWRSSSSERPPAQASSTRTVFETASRWRANSRAISAGGFRQRSAFGSAA